MHSPGAPPTSFTYLIPSINSTLGSRSASLQNRPVFFGGDPHVGGLKVNFPSLIRF